MIVCYQPTLIKYKFHLKKFFSKKKILSSDLKMLKFNLNQKFQNPISVVSD